MHTIRPIEALSLDDIRDLAISAADNHQQAHDANPFTDAGDARHIHFVHQFRARQRQLDAQAAQTI